MLKNLIENLKSSGSFHGHTQISQSPSFFDKSLGLRNQIIIINLQKSLQFLKEGLHFLLKCSLKRSSIFVAGLPFNLLTALAIINVPVSYVPLRWKGGFLTNYKHFKGLFKTSYTQFRRFPHVVILLYLESFLYMVLMESNILKIPNISLIDTDMNINAATFPLLGNNDKLSVILAYITKIFHVVFLGHLLRRYRMFLAIEKKRQLYKAIWNKKLKKNNQLLFLRPKFDETYAKLDESNLRLVIFQFRNMNRNFEALNIKAWNVWLKAFKKVGAVNQLKKLVASVYISRRNKWFIKQIIEKKRTILNMSINRKQSVYLFKKSRILSKNLKKRYIKSWRFRRKPFKINIFRLFNNRYLKSYKILEYLALFFYNFYNYKLRLFLVLNKNKRFSRKYRAIYNKRLVPIKKKINLQSKFNKAPKHKLFAKYNEILYRNFRSFKNIVFF